MWVLVEYINEVTGNPVSWLLLSTRREALGSRPGILAGFSVLRLGFVMSKKHKSRSPRALPAASPSGGVAPRPRGLRHGAASVADPVPSTSALKDRVRARQRSAFSAGWPGVLARVRGGSHGLLSPPVGLPYC